MGEERYLPVISLKALFYERSKIRMTTTSKHTLSILKYHDGKVSFFTHFKGSMTVEASLAVPIFFFAILSFLYLFEIMAIQSAVNSGLNYAGKMVMMESYPLSVVYPSKIEDYMVEAIGAERLERSIIIDGSTGIDCTESKMSLRTGIGTLSARYEMKIPVPGFILDGLEREQTIRIKAWTGYEKEYFGVSDEQIVYLTETGMVYHKDYHCTYLDLSIQSVSKESVEDLRNSGGGKYYACLVCGGRNESSVYITNNGNKYHTSLLCSGLKRTIYTVPLSEVIGKGACIRCGQ